MKNKLFLQSFLIAFVLAFIAGEAFLQLQTLLQNHQTKTVSVEVKQVTTDISASGTIHSENEAVLHFQIGGKLVYLPFKEGDSVTEGQTIAQLDTYALQRQLTQALNAYRSTRDSFDQTQENVQNGALHGSNAMPLNPFNPLVPSSVSITTGGDTQTIIMNDIVKRIIDQNQANLDNSVINVELANNALQLASLQSPINGIVVHEDVTTPLLTVTPQTTFAVADPTALVFRAQVLVHDIDFVSVGSKAAVRIDGSSDSFTGIVEKIYPQKIATANGGAYEVDIQSDGLQQKGKLGVSGTVFIQSNAQKHMVLVPSWAVVGNNFVWVLVNGTPKLQKVTVGRILGSVTEITSGIAPQDSVVIDPKSVAAKVYSLL